jgi:hypothetical protein
MPLDLFDFEVGEVRCQLPILGDKREEPVYRKPGEHEFMSRDIHVRHPSNTVRGQATAMRVGCGPNERVKEIA